MLNGIPGYNTQLKKWYKRQGKYTGSLNNMYPIFSKVYNYRYKVFSQFVKIFSNSILVKIFFLHQLKSPWTHFYKKTYQFIVKEKVKKYFHSIKHFYNAIKSYQNRLKPVIKKALWTYFTNPNISVNSWHLPTLFSFCMKNSFKQYDIGFIWFWLMCVPLP